MGSITLISKNAFSLIFGVLNLVVVDLPVFHTCAFTVNKLLFNHLSRALDASISRFHFT